MPKPRSKKRVLALPDLEQSKTAVLNSLTSKSGQRTYDRAITDFVEWLPLSACKADRERTLIPLWKLLIPGLNKSYEAFILG